LSFDNPKAVEIYTKKTELFPIEEKLFHEHLSNPQRILDIGCGTGRTTTYLNLMGHHVTGIDIAKLMIEKARSIHPDIDYRVMDATNLEFEDRSFDAALFSFNGLDCLYPVSKRTEALKEVHRVLRNGGVFIYSSHDIDAVRLTWRTLTLGEIRVAYRDQVRHILGLHDTLDKPLPATHHDHDAPSGITDKGTRLWHRITRTPGQLWCSQRS